MWQKRQKGDFKMGMTLNWILKNVKVFLFIHFPNRVNKNTVKRCWESGSYFPNLITYYTIGFGGPAPSLHWEEERVAFQTQCIGIMGVIKFLNCCKRNWNDLRFLLSHVSVFSRCQFQCHGLALSKGYDWCQSLDSWVPMPPTVRSMLSGLH